MKSQEYFAAFLSKPFAESIVKQWASCCEKHKGRDKANYLKLKRVRQMMQKVIFEIEVVCNSQEFHTDFFDRFCYAKGEGADHVTSGENSVLKTENR